MDRLGVMEDCRLNRKNVACNISAASHVRSMQHFNLGWVQIFWNNVPNGLRIMDQCGFPREEHLLESHRERGFIIPEGYKPLAGG